MTLFSRSTGTLTFENVYLAAPVCYCDIYDSRAFSMTLFFLPPASMLPLHSYPNMTVMFTYICKYIFTHKYMHVFM